MLNVLVSGAGYGYSGNPSLDIGVAFQALAAPASSGLSPDGAFQIERGTKTNTSDLHFVGSIRVIDGDEQSMLYAVFARLADLKDYPRLKKETEPTKTGAIESMSESEILRQDEIPSQVLEYMNKN